MIKGSTTTLEQKIESMEMEHSPVDEAKPGQSFGLKVRGKVRENDTVYRKI